MRYTYTITLTGSIEATTALEAKQKLAEQLEGKLPEAGELGTPWTWDLPDGGTEMQHDLDTKVELRPMRLCKIRPALVEGEWVGTEIVPND